MKETDVAGAPRLNSDEPRNKIHSNVLRSVETPNLDFFIHTIMNTVQLVWSGNCRLTVKQGFLSVLLLPLMQLQQVLLINVETARTILCLSVIKMWFISTSASSTVAPMQMLVVVNKTRVCTWILRDFYCIAMIINVLFLCMQLLLLRDRNTRYWATF